VTDPTPERPSEQSSPVLLFAVAALVLLVAVADLLSPLGLAVWVFYMLPLCACLFGRSPQLPLQVALLITACVGLLTIKPFASEALVQRWLALGNRSMYVSTLWPVAFMIRQLVSARRAADREQWLRGTQGNLLGSLQGELSHRDMAGLVLRGLSRALEAPVGAVYARSHGKLERIAELAPAGEAKVALDPGQGLIGEAFASGRCSILNDVPEGFLRVQAGVGEGDPRHVVVAPLRADGAVVAVVALGCFSDPDVLGRDLLDRISEPVAMALISAEHKARLRELFEEGQRQGEELQSQQAELEAQHAELEASNEELNQTNALMEVQAQELERQRDELALERKAAERASSHKSEFLANMSHELRTPLNSSLILARLLADNKEGNLNADQVRSAETIYAAGNDLLLLINDILDLAKIEAGRADVAREHVSLGRLLGGLEQAFRPVASQRQLDFQLAVAEGTPERFISDARRVEQILKNLLSNAFKFTERGDVRLAVSATGADELCFVVSDTGIGIAPDQREVIFEAFRQADGTTSRKYGGTGLGLSISRELSHLLGGRIELESEPGRGSRFSLRLPLHANLGQLTAPEPIASTRAARPEPRPGRVRQMAKVADDRSSLTRSGRLVLTVEDDPVFAKILYDLAHELEFDCVVASSAEEGLALARELSPSGILLDVGLPDASGLSVLSSLKRDPNTRHIPIHMVSVADHMQTALELGAIGYAVKPVARQELVAAIEKLEERHSRQVRRVLIVEDDEQQQASLRKLLSGQGIQLIGAGSVKEALETLHRASVDCMVLDLTLPDGSGYDLLERLAESGHYAFPPVIVYTGRDLGRDEEEKLRRYSRSIIVKGARSPERLLDEVTLFLHQVESALEPEQRRMLADARHRESAFEGRRILIVEDDVRNVFALSKILEPRGAKVEIARHGREALEQLARTPDIHLVLMDLMMPEMDGLTAIREIRKQPQFARLPIIALTAKAMPDDREHALAAGASDYMAKPFEVDRLVSLCRVWLPR
jgi:CheY-like chemotaxis protein/signal transduction histidine kinase